MERWSKEGEQDCFLPLKRWQGQWLEESLLFYGYFHVYFYTYEVGGAAMNISQEQILFKINKLTSISFGPSLCTLKWNLKKIKMPEPIYSSEQTEGLSYSYFMILLPEGIFCHNCAGIVAFIKEKKKKEGNYIAHPVFHFWWVVPHTTGAQRQACMGKPSDLPMALGGLNSTRVILPILPSPVCLNGKGGWWLCAARWGVFRGFTKEAAAGVELNSLPRARRFADAEQP